MSLITVDKLHAFAPRCDAETWAPLLDASGAAKTITTEQRVAHWLAQLSVESGYLTVFEENLGYSAGRLVAVWPRRFPTLAAAQPYANNPQALANKVYGGREGNGDEASGDGYRYRGRGLSQLTFKDGYALASKQTGVDLVANPDLLLQPATAALEAAAFWFSIGANTYADVDDVTALRRAWNGGSNGLDAAEVAFTSARKIWSA